MTINERDVAGIGIVNFTDQVGVAISILSDDSIEVALTPQSNAVSGATYVVLAVVDGAPSALQGAEWTAAEIASGVVKRLIFTGLDLRNVTKIIVGVDIDPAVAVITVADGAGGVGTSFQTSIVMDHALTGLSGYIIDATIVDPAVARFTDVTFPPTFPLNTHTPDPVSGPAVQLVGSDLAQVINVGDVDILLADLQIEGLAAGVSEVRLVVTRLDDDSGGAVRSIVRSGTITIS